MICVILTGGQSRRMGTDKALLPMDGKALSLHLAERLSVVAPVYFSVDRAGRFPVGSYGELIDLYPGQGPLNGIVSAFRQTQAQRVLLAATDMPNVTAEAARRLAAAVGQHDACIFANEPLFGLYSRRCLAAAESCLTAGRNAMKAFLAQVDVLRLDAEDEALFENLNTAAQWQQWHGRDSAEA